MWNDKLSVGEKCFRTREGCVFVSALNLSHFRAHGGRFRMTAVKDRCGRQREDRAGNAAPQGAGVAAGKRVSPALPLKIVSPTKAASSFLDQYVTESGV